MFSNHRSQVNSKKVARNMLKKNEKKRGHKPKTKKLLEVGHVCRRCSIMECVNSVKNTSFSVE